MKVVFFNALDKLPGNRMAKGANAGDLYVFLMEVKRLHLVNGRVISFKLKKQCGIVDGVVFNDFNVKCGLDKIVIGGGNFLLFGKSKRSTDEYVKFLKELKKMDDEGAMLLKWSKIADGLRPMDHAIGLKIADNGEKTLFDNGFKSGSKAYSLYNIADRMCDVSLCYAVDLWEE